MLCALALALAVAAPDERFVLQAPNIFGNQGLVRSTSALVGATGTASLGLSSRLFFTPDFVLVDVAEEGSEEPFTFTAMPKGELPDAPPIPWR